MCSEFYIIRIWFFGFFGVLIIWFLSYDMIDDSCHVIRYDWRFISCDYIMSSYYICFEDPCHMMYTIWSRVFCFPFLFSDSLGGLLFYSKKGGRTNTVSTHAALTVPSTLPFDDWVGARQSKGWSSHSIWFRLSLNSPPEKTQIIYR